MKAKIKRYSLMVLIGVPLLLYMSLALVYVQEKRAQATADDRVSSSLDLLSRPTPDMAALESDIADMDLAIAEAKGSFDVGSSEAIISSLLDRAQFAGLRVGGVAAKPIATRREDDKSYTVLPISVQATGEITQVLGFINGLDYPSMQVESVSLGMGDGNYSVNLELAVRLTPKE